MARKINVEKLLLTYMAEVGASSAILYIKDPIWLNEYRLICMPGVHLTEPMHGFMYPDDARHLISEGKCFEIHRKNVRDSRMFSKMHHRLHAVPQSRKRLFGNFVEREGVTAVMRRVHIDESGDVSMALFVNFYNNDSAPRDIKTSSGRLMEKLLTQVPHIIKSIRISSLPMLSRIPEIMNSTRDIAAFGLGEGGQKLEKGLKGILNSAMLAFGIEGREGFGSIHLYNETLDVLTLAAKSDPKIAIQEKQTVASGEGVIAWVAHRRRAMLIDDITTSPFKEIYIDYGRESQSEIAVPLLAGTKLLGVLNLESTKPKAFPHDSVRPLWYAANEAAILVRVHRQIEETRLLKNNTNSTLDLCYRVATESVDLEDAMNELAKIIREAFNLDACEIWNTSPPARAFCCGGYSGDNPELFCKPRTVGWSRHICETKQPVFVSSIQNPKRLEVRIWEDDAGKWRIPPESNTFPTEANEKILAKDLQCQIGIPILVHDSAIGVVWLKYFANIKRPNKAWMRKVRGFIGHAGLVIDCQQKAHGSAEQKAQNRMKATIRGALFDRKSNWENRPSWLDIEAHAEIHDSDLGGDFYAGVKLDGGAFGLLLGDAEGHGEKASFMMLPLVAAFRSIYLDSRSTFGVIRRLWNLSKMMEIRGTATYVIVRKIGERYWISGSTAGHDSLIVVRNDKKKGWDFFPRQDQSFNCGSLGVGERKEFIEDSMALDPGDLIIGCTDGIIDAGASVGDEFEYDENETLNVNQLVGTIYIHKHKGIDELARIILEKAREFDQGEHRDDATLVVMKIKE